MSLSRSLLAFAGVLVALSSEATEVRLTAKVSDGVAGVVGRLDAVSVDGHSQQLSVVLDGENTFQLPAGQWQIHVTAPGYWHPPLRLNAEGLRVLASLTMWRTGTLTGRVISPKGEPIPPELIIRFSRPLVDVASKMPEGEVTCAVASDGMWSCDVPAGRPDIRARARSYMTHFFWDTEVRQGRVKNFGRMPLVHGGSVIGRVELRSGNPAKTRVRITAVPASGDIRKEKDAPTPSVFFAVANPEGFFQIGGLPGGEYLVSAGAPDLTSETRRVRLLENGEVELLDPLVVDQPGVLKVTTSPPLDPSGRPWRIGLFAASTIGREDLVTTDAADREGNWTWKKLRTTRYRIVFGDNEGSTFASILFDGHSGTVDLPVDLATVSVEGTVYLGDLPLPSTVWFGGRDSAVSVRMTADADGKFAGEVRSIDRESIEVSIEATNPVVSRSVRVPIVKRDGKYDLEVRLPATTLMGSVVDEHGQRVPAGIVTISDRARSLFVQTKIEPDGTFVIHGLPPGTFVTKAAGKNLDESEAVEIGLSAEDAVATVVLTMKPGRRFTGRIVSASGPVPRAKITPAPTDVASLVLFASTADAEGKFAHLLPSGAGQIDVTIAASGFAFRMFHIPVPGTPLQIPVASEAGTLRVTTPHFDGGAGAQPYLRHEGAVIPLMRLTSGWVGRVQWSERDVAFEIPMMEPGQYSVCSATREQIADMRFGRFTPKDCPSGYLAPGGQLALSLTPR